MKPPETPNPPATSHEKPSEPIGLYSKLWISLPKPIRHPASLLLLLALGIGIATTALHVKPMTTVAITAFGLVLYGYATLLLSIAKIPKNNGTVRVLAQA